MPVQSHIHGTHDPHQLKSLPGSAVRQLNLHIRAAMLRGNPSATLHPRYGFCYLDYSVFGAARGANHDLIAFAGETEVFCGVDRVQSGS